MIVKKALTIFKSLKNRHVVVSVALLAVFILTALEIRESDSSGSTLLDQRTELAVRGIGDQLLKQAGDRSTPVPPVEKPDESTLRLRFEKAMTIHPDSLVSIVLNEISEDLASHLVINVVEASTQEMVYGFEINHKGESDIPCLGRELADADYQIDIRFYDQPKAASNYQISMISVAGLALVFLAFQGFSERKKEVGLDSVCSVGGFIVDAERSGLRYEGELIPLTNKEMSLALILFENTGRLVSREYLIDEIWSKEGVVTGRSLDMFISRLRKKLSINPNVKITNQHGKGYVLVVE